MCLFHPERGDMVATFGEVSASCFVQNLHSKMLKNKIGCKILREKPILSTKYLNIEYEKLRCLPKDTFGYVYYQFMKSNNINMDDRPPIQFVNDVELAYVMLRYRQIHDFIHTLTNQPTNLIGEITVKIIEAYQTKLPMCVLGSIFAPLRLKNKHFHFFLKHNLYWAIKTAAMSPLFINVYYEKEWNTPINELRDRLKIYNIPNTPMKKLYK
ncbi:hypothetical protein A3Q56_00926 [Intoshia linei]|uniref:Ubiquinone biosynthesis protein COQ4 homolog, mitochondrial n=1 Tax=Intoshia linei TaxID=1819745 RepID=A0A177BAQ0_9BILA|nr:hypothetical protein A3Q56_00926 [Intoshia linei]